LLARKQLANVRVIQKNLVYVLGLPVKLATEEILKSQDYFGQYGKITKIVINRKPASAQISNTGVYITYLRKEDAARAIEAVDGTALESRIIRYPPLTQRYFWNYKVLLLLSQVSALPKCWLPVLARNW
jgi:RNA recognition motif-containing protein